MSDKRGVSVPMSASIPELRGIPVMTRRGVVECQVTSEGYVQLPPWVEGNDDDQPGPCEAITRQQRANFRSEVVGILVDLNLVGAEAEMREDGTVGPKPTSALLAKVIRERDTLSRANDEQVQKIRKLEEELHEVKQHNKRLQEAWQDVEEQRKRAIECNEVLKADRDRLSYVMLQFKDATDDFVRRVTDAIGM